MSSNGIFKWYGASRSISGFVPRSKFLVVENCRIEYFSNKSYIKLLKTVTSSTLVNDNMVNINNCIISNFEQKCRFFCRLNEAVAEVLQDRNDRYCAVSLSMSDCTSLQLVCCDFPISEEMAIDILNHVSICSMEFLDNFPLEQHDSKARDHSLASFTKKTAALEDSNWAFFVVASSDSSVNDSFWDI